MATLYSTQLYSNGSLNGVDTLSPVPAGYIWIVRQVTFFAATVSPAGCFANINGGGMIFYGEVTASAPYIDWSGRHVLEAGDELSITTNVSTLVLVSGYVLTAP